MYLAIFDFNLCCDFGCGTNHPSWFTVLLSIHVRA